MDGEKPSDSQHQSDRVAAGRGWAWTQMLRGSPENPGKGRKPSKGAFQPEPSTHLPGSTLLSQRVNPKLGSREARRSRVWRAGGVSEVAARKGSTWRWGPGGGGGMGDRLVGMHGFCWGPGGRGVVQEQSQVDCERGGHWSIGCWENVAAGRWILTSAAETCNGQEVVMGRGALWRPQGS